MRCDLWLQLKEMFRDRFQKQCALFNLLLPREKGFGLEQKSHFFLLIGIVQDTAPSRLYEENPEMKIARETATFYATSNVSLILTNGQTQMHILWSAAQQPCDLFGSHCSTGATWAGQGCSSAWREQNRSGNQRAPRLRMCLR